MIVVLYFYRSILLFVFFLGAYPTYIQSSKASLTNHHTFHPSWWDALRCNFHTVQAGSLYRCKQLSPHRLDSLLKKLGIKTIINLRGSHPHKRWWIDERTVAQKHKVRFYNIPMCAKTASDKKHLLKLLSIYKKAPRPILIHCHHGADRTGEAAALWKLEQEKTTKEIALQQLSWRYWHIASRFPLKRRLINQWQGIRWLKHRYKPETIAIEKPNFIE